MENQTQLNDRVATTHLTDDTVEHLQSLIQANIDSCEGYKSAAYDVKNNRLRELFNDIAISRSRQAASLQAFVRWSKNDEEPEEDTSVLADLHRAWMNARAAINSGDEEVVLIETSRGESYLKDLYEDVLEEEIDEPIADVLHDHYARIKQDYQRIESLKNAYS